MIDIDSRNYKVAFPVIITVYGCQRLMSRFSVYKSGLQILETLSSAASLFWKI